ncbi:MAG: hypothetical protein JWQ50_3570 [Caballeronia mineralivorans]|jgi:hypothetical protein|nr:hypothetical protein [Caballeronia mineralivorans]
MLRANVLRLRAAKRVAEGPSGRECFEYVPLLALSVFLLVSEQEGSELECSSGYLSYALGRYIVPSKLSSAALRAVAS